MSLRDDLGTALLNAGVQYNNLVIDKKDDYHGREALHVGFIINGDAGPVFYDTWVTNDLKLNQEQEINLIATNAAKAYANHIMELKKL